MSKSYICYCIGTTDNKKTYVGATNDFKRRLRQHNGEIVGGAKYTSGETWTPQILVSGFGTRNDLLSFEWWWKHISRKNKEKPIFRRISMLEQLLQKERWENLIVYTTEENAQFININQLIEDISSLNTD